MTICVPSWVVISRVGGPEKNVTKFWRSDKVTKAVIDSGVEKILERRVALNIIFLFKGLEMMVC